MYWERVEEMEDQLVVEEKRELLRRNYRSYLIRLRYIHCIEQIALDCEEYSLFVYRLSK